jgi:hypothetical protein
MDDKKKQTPIDTLNDDIQFVEAFKNESITAMALYNFLCQLYNEEGEEGFESLKRMWRVAVADMKQNDPFN